MIQLDFSSIEPIVLISILFYSWKDEKFRAVMLMRLRGIKIPSQSSSGKNLPLNEAPAATHKFLNGGSTAERNGIGVLEVNW